ncbi:MAG TPA: hypothetical protein VHG91_17030 [Longimicrobium sp.]|nr:hypothetical protein [Longimicrobium sp.]
MTDTPPPSATRQRALWFFGALLAALALGLLPAWCSGAGAPAAYYPTRADAPATGDDALPAVVPPSAREVHARRETSTGRRWIRFAYDPADLPAMTAGARRLSVDEVKRLSLTFRPPPYSGWWNVNPGALRGSQGKRLQVFQLPGSGGAWLAADPRSHVAFYWSGQPAGAAGGR